MAVDRKDQNILPGIESPPQVAEKQVVALRKKNGYEPPNLGKAIRLPVPDFNDPDRPVVCLEVDFPIAPINALSKVEVSSGPARKRVYCMSKWWARRASSVFRSMLIGSAVLAPGDSTSAAKIVWDHYYCNHQKAGSFRKLRVLDIFMGGGTTLVEGARLGMQMVGIDLNPVAWFVTKNELACSDPEQVKALFDHIEAEVKPLVQPLYTTTCPRGHEGRWVDIQTGRSVDLDALDLPPEDRKRYRWEGAEVIYTFWAKYGPCQAKGCGHRTPVFRSPVIAEKKLSTAYIPANCPSCGHSFDIELGETRMAPGVERVVLDSEPSFTETTQHFAQLLNDYSKGNADEKYERIEQLRAMVEKEPGLCCPSCGAFAGSPIKAVLERHAKVRRVSDLKKKDFGIEKRPVYMYLLIHPEWLDGASGFQNDRELGGYAGAPADDTIAWYESRLKGLRPIEVRGRIKLADEEASAADEDESPSEEDAGESSEEETEEASDRKKYGLPREIVLKDGTRIQTRVGTVPQQSHFTCGKCGRLLDLLEAVRSTEHTAPVAPYALQCHCLQCQEEGYNYGGRYFKAPEAYDIIRLGRSEREWAERANGDLSNYWPRQECWDAYMMRANGGVNKGWGYTHWWKMFNARQLLIHTQLLRGIANAPAERWTLDVREQALGAWQEYSRHQSMFCFWDIQQDCLAPSLANANFHPKNLVVENNAWMHVGRANWRSCVGGVISGMEWVRNASELVENPSTTGPKTLKVFPGDSVPGGTVSIFCGSATDLSIVGKDPVDLVITDPPFGNNLFYADLADFFYVWLRIPLLKWYGGMPEEDYFKPERTPHAIEAVDNPVEHPDDREDWEKQRLITAEIQDKARELTGDKGLNEKDLNPLYRPEPASEFYQQTLTACWAEAGRLLKPGGLMAFTFHHSADAPWVDVLEALFNAGYILVATYPIRSDETKGESGAFGSRKIEYDIIHVCRKRLEQPQPVSWSRMRRWVKDEASRLKELLEHSHGKTLSKSDLRVILFGKALEFYSRHYGQVVKNAYLEGGQTKVEVLDVKEALLGIDQLLQDLLETDAVSDKTRLPDIAEPTSRLFLRMFNGRRSMSRDELHKTLRGTGMASDDLESRGWIRVIGTTVHVVPIAERFQYFTVPGRNRKVLKTDLDQTHFLIGAARPGSGLDVTEELNRRSFSVKKSVDALLDWYAKNDSDDDTRRAAQLAGDLVGHWRARPGAEAQIKQMALFDQLEAEDS